MEEKFNKKDVIVMKLLHYFITEKNYSPVVLQGAQNEIWLENMNSDYKIVRIVSNYIHNNEQLNFDLFKTNRIVKSIKRKTLNLHMDVLSIFVDLGDSVNLESTDHIDCVYLEKESDLKKYDFLYQHFPDIDKKMTFTEKGLNLFVKITSEINEKNKAEAKRVENIFKPKTPIVTYILIGINILFFLSTFVLGDNFIVGLFALYGPNVRAGEYYRIITSAFTHIDFFHILFNMYALKIIGSQVESFFGRWRYLLIYFFSAITGSLLSMLLNINAISIGASGAIFGLFGAMLYFGYRYRVYLGNTVLKKMLPIVIINLLLGFALTNVDNFAHIGGLAGGILISMAVGLGDREKKSNIINGIILSIIFVAFLIYMNFFYL